MSDLLKIHNIDSKLDLVLERIIDDVKPELIWKAWTQPELLMQWFCPQPWKTIACEIDLRPGGKFSTTMQSPDGMKFPNTGCYLEVIENRKLVWTDVLHPGFRPINKVESGADLSFTAIILLEPHKSGTHYTAIGMHRNETDRLHHDQMGFHKGWGIALDQLLDVVRKL